jgi:hypothetical protein
VAEANLNLHPIFEEKIMLKSALATILLLNLLLCSIVSADPNSKWEAVSGTGIHYASTSQVHPNTIEVTPEGMNLISTDIVQLFGDLEGRALFQPHSVINFVEGTVVNTGHQVFSGTVLGSQPVMLYDDDFRFEIDIDTGATTGEIFLTSPIAGPKVWCVLTMVGTGQSPEGDNLSEYTGQCRRW